MLDGGWGHGEKRFSGPSRYGDLGCQPQVLIIELGYGEPAGEGFPGATRNPREWISNLENDGREVFFFLLHVDKSECLRRVAARGNLSPGYAAMAWDRFAPCAVCSSAAFTSRIGDSYSEDTLSTMDKDPTATVKQILDAVGAV